MGRDSSDLREDPVAAPRIVRRAEKGGEVLAYGQVVVVGEQSREELAHHRGAVLLRHQGGVECDDATETVPDNHRPIDTQPLTHPGQVVHKPGNRVVLLRRIALAMSE